MQKAEIKNVPPLLQQHNVSSIPFSLSLEQAQKIAVSLCYKLQPFCEKINIAGSVRRQKSFVKDIEIVCVPKKQIFSNDLFELTQLSKPLFYFEAVVRATGQVLKGKPDGKYMQIGLPEGINLDLFIPDDFDYYRQYAIRTGSADYSAKVIAGGWRKIGWCGSDKGLRKMTDCIETKTPDGKSKWKCVKQDAELPPIFKSEHEFFEWIKVKMLHPSQRVV